MNREVVVERVVILYFEETKKEQKGWDEHMTRSRRTCERRCSGDGLVDLTIRTKQNRTTTKKCILRSTVVCMSMRWDDPQLSHADRNEQMVCLIDQLNGSQCTDGDINRLPRAPHTSSIESDWRSNAHLLCFHLYHSHAISSSPTCFQSTKIRRRKNDINGDGTFELYPWHSFSWKCIEVFIKWKSEVVKHLCNDHEWTDCSVTTTTKQTHL